MPITVARPQMMALLSSALPAQLGSVLISSTVSPAPAAPSGIRRCRSVDISAGANVSVPHFTHITHITPFAPADERTRTRDIRACGATCVRACAPGAGLVPCQLGGHEALERSPARACPCEWPGRVARAGIDTRAWIHLQCRPIFAALSNCSVAGPDSRARWAI